MRISIIIPVVNEEAFIGHAIDSAWAAGGDEVIVVDGGSRDSTREIAGQRDCSIVRSERGRGLQQNAGAREATGEVLLFQHADSWLEANATDQIRQTLAREKHCAGAFRQRIDSPGLAFRLLEWGNASRVRWLRMPYGDQGIFIRNDVLKQLGGFPHEPLMEDVILMQRLAKLSRPVLLPGPLHLSSRRWRRHGVLRQTLRNWSLIAAYRAGVSPQRLARYYRPHDADAAGHRTEALSGTKP